MSLDHEEQVSVTPSVGVGAERHVVKNLRTDKVLSMHAHVIAGPITAAQLGVPVGTIIDERHVDLTEEE